MDNPNRVPAAAGGEGRDASSSAQDGAALQAQHEADVLRKQLEQLRKKAVDLNAEYQSKLDIAKALHNYQRATPAPVPPATVAPTAGKRKRYQMVPLETAAQIAENVIEKGMEWKTAAETFNVSRSKVAEIVRDEKAARSGEARVIAPAKKRGRKPSFTSEMLVFICYALERDASLTLKDLQQQLHERFQLDVGLPAISKTLGKLKITWKNVLKIPDTWNDERTVAARVQFIDKVMEALIKDKEFIYVDEQGYNLHVRKSKGRALAGRRAVITLKPKGQRVSVIAALSKSGIIRTKLVDSLGPAKRGLNADDFRLFVHDLRPQLRGKVLILDNAKIHHAEELEALWPELKQLEDIDTIFLPPYSPFINAIEYAFNKMRLLVKQAGPENRAALKEAVTGAAVRITASDADGFFHKAKSYWEQSRLGMPFSGTPLDPLGTPPPMTDVFDTDEPEQ